MTAVLLYCKDSEGVHVGPGLPRDPSTINFVKHWATIDTDSPWYADQLVWIAHPGSPHIEIKTAEEKADILAYEKRMTAMTDAEFDTMLAARKSGRR